MIMAKKITNEEERQYVLRQVRARSQRMRGIFQSIKENTPCTDCGKCYPYYVMQFDHREPVDKKWKVSSIGSSSKLKIFKELAKCDVVCANCHAKRTYRRNPSREVIRPFWEWQKKFIVSLVPRDDKFLVICSGCGKHYWSPATAIRWELDQQELYCSLTCGIHFAPGYWWKRHKEEIREFMGDTEFTKMKFARLSRTEESMMYRLTWEHPKGSPDHVPDPGIMYGRADGISREDLVALDKIPPNFITGLAGKSSRRARESARKLLQGVQANG